MNQTSPCRGIRAALIFPVAGPPIVNGVVRFEAGRIVSIGSEPASGADPDEQILNLPDDLALIPGLVNAHTHLEFSDLAQPLGTAGSPLPTWIRQVVAHRRGSPSPLAAAISQGLEECLTAGTTLLGEIATNDWRSQPDLPQTRPTTLMFWESLGLTPAAASAAIERADQFMDQTDTPANILRGLSPHAPYSVHPTLLAHLIQVSRRENLPVAMHLAESREELELIEHGNGLFRDMLQAIGAWDASPTARLDSIEAYLLALAEAPRALVIHGNYLRAEHWNFLAERAQRMALVYCPRTHGYFCHPPYPLVELLERGVHVALGTDSRASSPSLSLFDEAKFVAQHHPLVSPHEVLRMATQAGAEALGLAKDFGTLEPGKRANLAVVRLGDHDLADAHHRLLNASAQVVQTWLDGRLVCST